MKSVLITAMLCVFYMVDTRAQNAEGILGKWANPTGEAHILVYRSGKTFSGKLNWVNESVKGPKTDANNPNKEMRGKPLLGLELLKGFEYKADGIYENGTIYDPKNGKTYSCKMTVDGDKLKIRGYISVSLLGRSEVWTRVK